MLRDLKAHLMAVKTCSLFELCLRFNAEPDVVRCMLSHFIRKGTLCCYQKTSRCGGKCNKCDPAFTEMYAWKEG